MEKNNKSVIQRASKEEQSVKRESVTEPIRNTSEVQAAYKQVGYTPNRNTKSWYRDIYEFYQNNEV